MKFRNHRYFRPAGMALVLCTFVFMPTGVAFGQGKSGDWVASWAAAVTGAEAVGSSHDGFNNQSYRMGIRLSVGGDQIRVRLTNIYGTQTVAIGHATVAQPNTGTPQASDIIPATLHELTFNGKTAATILQGDELYSDPLDMSVSDGADLIVTLYFSSPTGPATWHVTSRQSNFRGPGDLTASTDGPWDLRRDCCWFFLSGVDVLRHQEDGAIAVLGDSISDGNGSTLNAKTRWTDLLARRIVNQKGNNKQPSVVNVSLSGNRLNHEGLEPGPGGFTGSVQLGPNAGARLNEDVFTQTGVTTGVIELGIDDIWMNDDSADAIVDSLRKIVTSLQQRGLAVVVSTITPFHGFEQQVDGAWTDEKESTRIAVNAFIRSSRDFDVVDFDLLLRDPADPTRLRAEYDSGDHLHPNDLGAQQMANFFPLLLLP